MDLQLERFASAEAQVAAIADDIAWHTHDIDDGLRAGLIDRDALHEVPLVRDILADTVKIHRQDPDLEVYEVTRRLITMIIADAVEEARQRLSTLQPATAGDIRNADRPMITFSANMKEQLDELRTFLFAHLYRHKAVMRVMDDAKQVVNDLVNHYADNPKDLPEAWSVNFDHMSERCRLRRTGDFVAGMTDRYAIAEHRRLFDGTPELRYSADHTD